MDNKKARKKPLHSGYVYLYAAMDLQIQSLLKEIQDVLGWAGSGSFPLPLSREEVASLLSLSSGESAHVHAISSGDKIRVKSGLFRDMIGIAEEVRPQSGEIRSRLLLFGYLVAKFP